MGKNILRVKKFYCRENYKRSRTKKFRLQKKRKKGRQKFVGLVGKNLERTANSRSAAGGRHPSYATEHRPSICYVLVLA